VTAGWPWGPGSSRAVTVTGPTGLRAQRALCTVQPHRGSCEAGAGVVSAALYITARCASARFASFMTVPNGAKSHLARAVDCLRATVRGLAPACWLLQQAGASPQPPVCESQRDPPCGSSPSQSGLS